MPADEANTNIPINLRRCLNSDDREKVPDIITRHSGFYSIPFILNAIRKMLEKT
jgi:hypothetical protein